VDQALRTVDKLLACFRIAVLMKTRQHIDGLIINGIKERIGKPIQIRSPQLSFYTRVQEWITGYEAIGALKFVKEIISHANAGLLVPLISLGYLKFSQWLVDNLEQHAQWDAA
jgi:hypothetical protein